MSETNLVHKKISKKWMQAKFGLSPVPVEALPKDWCRRETKEKDVWFKCKF